MNLPKAILTLQGGALEAQEKVQGELDPVVSVMDISREADRETVQRCFWKLDDAYPSSNENHVGTTQSLQAVVHGTRGFAGCEGRGRFQGVLKGRSQSVGCNSWGTRLHRRPRQEPVNYVCPEPAWRLTSKYRRQDLDTEWSATSARGQEVRSARNP